MAVAIALTAARVLRHPCRPSSLKMLQAGCRVDHIATVTGAAMKLNPYALRSHSRILATEPRDEFASRGELYVNFNICPRYSSVGFVFKEISINKPSGEYRSPRGWHI